MRLDKDRQLELEPKRIAFDKKAISDLGFSIIEETSTSFSFIFRGEKVRIFPYSGWFTGKTVKDGRGIKNLLKQIKNESITKH
jgi:hypothetical protein